MTQFQFDVICRIIEVGAPALAVELCNALDSVVKDRNALADALEQLNRQTTEVASSEQSK
jgi:hypothetical protein